MKPGAPTCEAVLGSDEMEKTLALLDLEDGYFLSHRRALARAAQAAGYRVLVCVRRGADRLGQIRAEGFACCALGNDNKAGLRLWSEALALLRLIRAYRKHRPHIAHHFGVRNLLQGALAARLARTPLVVQSFVGLGSLFTTRTRGLRLVRKVLCFLLRRLHARDGVWVIVQNDADKKTVLENALAREARLLVVRGSGVDVREFYPAPEPTGPPLAVLAARMLAEKGVREFVEAARLLRRENAPVRMVLVGAPDPKNPSSLSGETLAGWQREGAVEWWGYKEGMANVWRNCHIAVLPTYYGEGLPKSLLEAAASARPLVATDVPGCRTVLEEGVNGLRIAPKDARGLADAIARLAGDAALRREMGAAGRRMVEERFRDEIVLREILALYARMEAQVCA